MPTTKLYRQNQRSVKRLGKREAEETNKQVLFALDLAYEANGRQPVSSYAVAQQGRKRHNTQTWQWVSRIESRLNTLYKKGYVGKTRETKDKRAGRYFPI